jgi:C1A family cysteine protease
MKKIIKNQKNRAMLIILTFIFGFNQSIIAQLPQVFDLRSNNLVTAVKNQDTCGSCWAFASIASIESVLLNKGKGTYNLSEDNIIDCHSFDESPCSGGSYYMSNALFARHQGPLLTSSDSYTPFTKNCPFSFSFTPSIPFYVEDIRFLPKNTGIVKQAIYSNGAIATTMFFNIANFNSTTNKYFDNVIDSTDDAHCVTLVGWNDTMSFSGTSNKGGWIVKDSYGTLWAQQGYFYVSYHDAGILTETAYFPVIYDIPLSSNKSNVYYHDFYGWVDNYGFSGSNIAYGLVKYTISPFSGVVVPQQIKRIGTYAVADSTTITIEIYKSFSGLALSDLIATKTQFCEFKGFYTLSFSLPTDTINTDIYIKATYQTPASITKPIPVEKYEAYHTTNISLSSNSCYISSSAQNWILTGTGSNYAFDLCIKMFTEDAPKSIMISNKDTICAGSSISFIDSSTIHDSIQWFVDGIYYNNSQNNNILFNSSGLFDISLVTHLGNNTDTSHKIICVLAAPSTPGVSQSVDTLFSTIAASYQWYDSFGILMNDTCQKYQPYQNGTYFVKITNQLGCSALSSAYNFISSNCNPVSVVNQPIQYQTSCSPSVSLTLTTIANGANPISYQWQYKKDSIWEDVVDGTPSGSIYLNQNTNSMSFYGIYIADTHQYRCLLTNCGGLYSDSTNIANIVVFENPLSPVISVTQPSCILATATVNVTSPTGTGVSYCIDGTNYTNTSGIFSNLTPGLYYIKAKNSNACISDSTNVVINNQPNSPSKPNVNITEPDCNNATAIISVTSDTNGLSFSKDGINYNNTNGIFTNISANSNYSITAKNNNGCVSEAATGIINAQPQIPVKPDANAATSITSTGFTANWDTVSGAVAYYIDISQNNNFLNFVTGFENLIVTSGNWKNVSGLVSNTSYYYRVRAHNSQCSSGNSDTVIITTLSLASVSTLSMSNIKKDSAQSGGNVTADGGSNITARGVCWNQTASPTLADSYTTDSLGLGTFTSTISGLYSGYTYYVRAYATNAVGTAYGNQNSFTTIASSELTVTNNFNSGYGSLRDAITYISNNGKILFSNSMDGKTITLISGTLSVNKNITLNNSNHNSGIIINGSGDNITIQSGNKLIIDSKSKITVKGTIKNNAGINGLLIASAASFIHNTTNLQATAQLYLTKGWHLFGSPFVKNSNSSLSNISPLGGNIQMKSYRDGNGWNSTVSSAYFQFTPNVGYAVNPSITSTASLSGILFLNPNNYSYLNSYPYFLTYSFSAFSSSNGWNLLANPFTSYLNWNLLDKYNVSNTLYLWDNTLYPYISPTTNNSNFRTYNGSSNVGVPSGTSPYIAPFQGFFVKSSFYSPKLIFNLSARTHNISTFYKDYSTEILVRLKVESDECIDELVICRNQSAKNEFEDYDSEKILNESCLEFYSFSSTGEKLTINTINDFNISIPLGLNENIKKNIKISAFDLEAYEKVYLEDRYKSMLISLSENTEYEFESNLFGNQGRFFIKFGNAAMNLTNSDIKVFVNDNFLNIIAQTGENIEFVEIYSLTGNCIYKTICNCNLLKTKLQLAPSIYLVKIKTTLGIKNEKVNWK